MHADFVNGKKLRVLLFLFFFARKQHFEASMPFARSKLYAGKQSNLKKVCIIVVVVLLFRSTWDHFMFSLSLSLSLSISLFINFLFNLNGVSLTDFTASNSLNNVFVGGDELFPSTSLQLLFFTHQLDIILISSTFLDHHPYLSLISLLLATIKSCLIQHI